MDKKAKILIGVLISLVVIGAILLTILVSAWNEPGTSCKKEDYQKWECRDIFGAGQQHQCMYDEDKGYMWDVAHSCGRGNLCDSKTGRCDGKDGIPTTPEPTPTPSP